MPGARNLAIRGTSDGEDRLLSADPALAALQGDCGGAIPGTIAVPALLEAVRKARRCRLKLARAIMAQNGSDAVRVWAEITPRADGQDGCDIVLRDWYAAPLPVEDAREVEGRRADLDRNLAEFFARLDSQQRVITAHADARDLHSLASAMNEAPGTIWTDFLTVQGHAAGQLLHWRLLEGAQVSVEGSQRPWRASLEPHRDGGSEPIGFELRLIAGADLPVSEPVRAAPNVPALIGADVAPVLRQPLSRIIAHAETIRARLAGPIPDEYAGYAADIASAGQHLLALLNDLGDLDLVEADDFAPVTERIDLAEIARQAAGILGVRARERGIRMEMPTAAEAAPALGEARRVLQILLNLLGNAIRYSPANTTIALSLDRDGDRACLAVVDQGPGLSAEECAKVFEKFERLGRSGDGGSGLGLYISRRLARAMGGDLNAKSAPGEGARFVLELPAATEG